MEEFVIDLDSANDIINYDQDIIEKLPEYYLSHSTILGSVVKTAEMNGWRIGDTYYVISRWADNKPRVVQYFAIVNGSHRVVSTAGLHASFSDISRTPKDE